MLLLSILACAFLDPTPPPETITVIRGDTLYKLGKKHGVTVAELKTWNSLTSDRIEVGQELVLLRTKETAPVGKAKPRPRRSRPNGRSEPTPQPGGADGPQVPKLPFPKAKKCLSGPDGSGLGDEGSVASEGLSYNQAKRAMDAFLPKIGTCLVDFEAVPSQALELSISVGCDGRVTGVGVTQAGDWPSLHRNCVTKAIERAPFPAHALPDGDTFLYPLRMR